MGFELSSMFMFMVVAAIVLWGWGLSPGIAQRRYEQRRARLVEQGDLEGLLTEMGMTFERLERGRARGVDEAAGLVVTFPHDTLHGLTGAHGMRFGLDLSAFVEPGLTMREEWEHYDAGKDLYRGVPAGRYHGKRVASELLDVRGERVDVLALSATRFGLHVLSLHADISPKFVAITLEEGELTLVPVDPGFILLDGGVAAIKAIVGKLRVLHGEMSRRPPLAEELALVVGDAERGWGWRVDAAKALMSRGMLPEAELEAVLVDLFTSPGRVDDEVRKASLEEVAAAGWAPGPEAARRLALEGDWMIRRWVFAFVQEQPAPGAYVGALVVLRQAQVPGAAEFFDALGLDEAGGGLSLSADDGVGGGLSQAGERGGLSDVEV